jgi:hypothetical protein
MEGHDVKGNVTVYKRRKLCEGMTHVRDKQTSSNVVSEAALLQTNDCVLQLLIRCL